jgi:hypothetical protein
MRTSRTLVASALLAGLAGSAWAMTVPAASSASSASADILHGTRAGHAWQSGGFGADEVAAMNRQDAPYNLRLAFSEGKHNDYVTGLKLRIESATGKPVFTLSGAGPLTDVALAPGQYKVVADYHGVARTDRVTLKKGEPLDLYLHWPKDEA